MTRIFFINGTGAVSRGSLLRALSGCRVKGALFLDGASAAQEGTLRSLGVARVPVEELPAVDAEGFMAAYNELIADISLQHASLLWWASDLANRNRETSILPKCLAQFQTVAAVIESGTYDALVIVGAETKIIPSLLALTGRKDNLGRLLLWFQQTAATMAYFVRLLIDAVRIMARAYYVRRVVSLKLIDREPAYRVIKSYLYRSSFDRALNHRDPFFVRAVDKVAQSGPALLLINMIGDARILLDLIERGKKRLDILPLDLFIFPGDVALYFLKLLAFRVRLSGPVSFMGRDVTDIVRRDVADIRRKVQFFQLLHYPAMRRFLKTFRVKSFLMTYESSGWERMFLLALRAFSRGTEIVGSQHSVVPLAAFALFVPAKEKAVIPLPDRILFNGFRTKDILGRYGAYAQGSLEVGCALRYEYLQGLARFPRRQTRRVLLALEGVQGVHKMVDYVVGQLAGSDYELVIRCHPVLPMSSIEKELSVDLRQCPNVSVSAREHVREDVEDCSAVIYWGTTVAIEALWMGRPVINFDMGGPLNWDPLFECAHLKICVSAASDLKEALGKFDRMTDTEFEKEWSLARRYLEDYFVPVTEENLQKYVV